MTDRLARSGLLHLAKCLFCDQEAEIIQHILCGCVFSRQVWSPTLCHYDHQDLSPSPLDRDFFGWWSRISKLIPGDFKLGLNSLITLVAWMLCKHRNEAAFNGQPYHAESS